MPWRPQRWADVFGLDIFHVQDNDKRTYKVLSIVDLATGWQAGYLLETKTSKEVRDKFLDVMAFSKKPKKLVYDAGKEFCSATFRQVGELFGAELRPIPTESPWQNGIVERHGGVLADIVRAIVEEQTVAGWAEMYVTVRKAMQAKNARVGLSGYSPQSLAFGHDQDLWASGLSSWLEEPDDAAIELAHTDPTYARAYKIRETAMRKVVELDHSDKWRAALKSTARADRDVFFPGDQVYYWRRQRADLKAKVVKPD